MAKRNANSNLQAAKVAKNDEFYTQLVDIERELEHYRHHFKDKIVFCNCDDPEWSNFWRYFYLNFNYLGLKKLISTHYTGITTNMPSYKLVYDGINENKINLSGTGDFRSPECIEILKESDIIVTNPPFSLFREYVSQLIEYDKKFLIIGNKNAISFKEFFPFLQQNKVWIGCTVPVEFKTPTGEVTKSLTGLTRWFTNLDIKRRHEDLILTEKYTSEKYPKYDNFDAINVSKVADIPCDYKGVMGVPITFMDKHNPEQFEIVGNEYTLNISKGRGYVAGKRIYSRIFIRRVS